MDVRLRAPREPHDDQRRLVAAVGPDGQERQLELASDKDDVRPADFEFGRGEQWAEKEQWGDADQ